MDTNIWCELTEGWLRWNGTYDLDALQSLRLREHLRICRRCGIELSDIVTSVDWPHLADITLEDWLSNSLTASERQAVDDVLRLHLASCVSCNQRLEMLKRTGLGPNEADRVIGSAAPILVALDDRTGQGEVTWIIDQPQVGLSTWKVILTLRDGSLFGQLETWTRRAGVQWTTFAVVLTGAEGLLGTLVFSAGAESTWMSHRGDIGLVLSATAVLTAPTPGWTRLLVVGGEPDTMISLAQQGRPCVVRMPFLAKRDRQTIEARLTGLFCDLRGAPLRVLVAPDVRERGLRDIGPATAFSGRIIDPSESEVGSCTGQLEAGVLELTVTPRAGAVIRASTADDDEPRIREIVESRVKAPVLQSAHAGEPGSAEPGVKRRFLIELREFVERRLCNPSVVPEPVLLDSVAQTEPVSATEYFVVDGLAGLGYDPSVRIYGKWFGDARKLWCRVQLTRVATVPAELKAALSVGGVQITARVNKLDWALLEIEVPPSLVPQALAASLELVQEEPGP